MNPIHLNEDVIYRKIGNQSILVPIGNNIDKVRSIFSLNETAAFIFDLIKDKKTIDEISQTLISEYDFSDIEQARTAVNELIDELRQHKIVL